MSPRSGGAKKPEDDDDANGALANADRSHLKPKFEPGDEVYAAWEPPDDGIGIARNKKNSDTTWKSGAILSHREIPNNYINPYGPKRLYHIVYEDGDEKYDVEDCYVYPKSDYLLFSRGTVWNGVKNETDGSSHDKWAKFIGWYVANIEGREVTYSRLTDAMHAYDRSLIQRGEVNESDLNLPEKWLPLLNSNLVSGEDEEVESSSEGERGEYVDDIDQQKRPFSLLSDDMEAHGKSAVQGKRDILVQSEEHASDKFNVTVQFPDGECGDIETAKSETIHSFKMSIEEIYGRSYVTNKLMFEEVELENKKLISEYNIGNDSIVVTQMQIYVYFLFKKGFFLDVDPDTTGEMVKIMIWSKEPDLSVTQQRISLNGNNLEDEMTISQSSVSDGDNLFVHVVQEDGDVPPKAGCIQIYVKCSDAIRTLDVKSTDKISDLKNMLWTKEGVRPENQRLSFGGEDLKNDSYSLWECSINSESLLYLVGQKEPQSENAQANVGNEIHLQEHKQGDRATIETKDQEKVDHESRQTNNVGEKITVFFVNQNDPDGIPFEMSKSTTPLHEVFSEYSQKVQVPLESLEFTYGEYEALPAQCDFTAEQLGISPGDMVMVKHTTPSSFIQEMLEERLRTAHPVLDLTGFSTGEDAIVITLKGIGNDTPVKVDRNGTTLQLVFSSFADTKSLDPASLVYVYGARRLSHEADETAAQNNIGDESTIHAIVKKNSNETNVVPQGGKVILYVLEMGKPESEKQFFNVDVNKGIARILERFAERTNIELAKLRFLYQGMVIYADPKNDKTPAQLGISEGNNTIHALVKKEHTASMPLTPNAIKTLSKLQPNQIFEPVVQVLELDTIKRKLTISDSAEFISLPFHPRLKSQIENGIIRKFAIIYANDIFFENHKVFLKDAGEAAPNPGRIIGSPTKWPTLKPERTSTSNENTHDSSDEDCSKENEIDHTAASKRFGDDWTISQHLFKMPRGKGSQVHRKWLTRGSVNDDGTLRRNTFGSKRFYCPQVGDSVVYIPKAHDSALKKFPVAGYSQPWEPWSTESAWPAVRCTVAHVRYRFPYKKFYNTQGQSGNFLEVSAIVSLEITGVPSESTGRSYPWPSPSFIHPIHSEKNKFEVTLFQCGEENFIIPEYLYSWRINELERAVESNDMIADGISATVYWPPNQNDDNKTPNEDAAAEEYKGDLAYINRKDHDQLHLADSGYHSVVMEYDGILAVCCAWNVTVRKPSVPLPSFPSMPNKAKRNVEIAFKKVVGLDPKIKKFFLDPVNTSKYTDYLDRIEVPMHLSLIQMRLQNNYYTNKYSVVADMELVKDNCYKYNEDDSEMCKMASLMYGRFRSLLDLMVEEGHIIGSPSWSEAPAPPQEDVVEEDDDEDDVMEEYEQEDSSVENGSVGDMAAVKSAKSKVGNATNTPNIVEKIAKKSAKQMKKERKNSIKVAHDDKLHQYMGSSLPEQYRGVELCFKGLKHNSTKMVKSGGMSGWGNKKLNLSSATGVPLMATEVVYSFDGASRLNYDILFHSDPRHSFQVVRFDLPTNLAK